VAGSARGGDICNRPADLDQDIAEASEPTA
jgi:hypothetical protein